MSKKKPDFCKGCPVGGTFREQDQTCSVSDPGDGLPLTCVGEWTEDKHSRVRKYVDISKAVRRKFLIGRGGATYVDLFCGPGRSRIRGTVRIIDGSALVAARKAIEGNAAFTDVHVADENEAFLTATRSRLQKLGVAVTGYVGPAEHVATKIATTLSPAALHFAFLDPYDLRSLPFSIVQRLAALERMDILIHVSAQDLQRNLRRYIESKQSPLDSFAPGWRTVVAALEKDANIRTKVFAYWLDRIRALNMQPAQGVEEVIGTKNQHLYWLVFVARHDLAIRFWNEIRNIDRQRPLGL
jgi:three-Cys-motif partner protein